MALFDSCSHRSGTLAMTLLSIDIISPLARCEGTA
jgi:hypothetical protein